MQSAKNNYKAQIKQCYQHHKETGNGVWKIEINNYFKCYRNLGGTMTLNKIVNSDSL